MPYTIDDSFTESERVVIAGSMADIESKSCVRWEPRVGDEQLYVRIKQDERGCFANVGPTVGGILNLGSGCIVSIAKINQMGHKLVKRTKMMTQIAGKTSHTPRDASQHGIFP